MSVSRSTAIPHIHWPPIVAGVLGTAAMLFLLATQSPVLAGAAGVSIVIGVIILRAPWIAYLLLVASVPAQQFVGIPAGGRVVTATQLAFVAAVGAYGVWVLARRQEIILSWLLVPLGALLVMMLISSVFAEHTDPALAEVARWLVAGTAFFLGLQFIPQISEWRVTPFVIALALGAVFEAGFGVVQSVLALGPESFLVDSGVSRAFGTFGEPNTYAAFLEITFFPVVAFGLYYVGGTWQRLATYRSRRIDGIAASTHDRQRLLLNAILALVLLGASTITLLGIVASLSRGAWLGVAAGIAVTGLLAFRTVRIGSILGVPVLALVLAASGTGLAPAPVEERIAGGSGQFDLLDPVTTPITDENFATLERLAHWHAGIAMFEDSPVLGVGIGNFDERYDDFWVRQEFRFSRGHAHNYYIQTLAETGLLGICAYASLIGGLIALALLTLRRSITGLHRATVLGALGMVIAVAVHNSVENLHVLNLGITQAFVWSLIVTTSRAPEIGEPA